MYFSNIRYHVFFNRQTKPDLSDKRKNVNVFLIPRFHGTNLHFNDLKELKEPSSTAA